MQNLRRNLLLGLVFGLLVMIALLIIGDLQAVRRSLTDFPWRWLPAILAATLFNYVLRFFKWHYYLRLMGARAISWQVSARVFLAGFPLSVTPGKIGEALKAVWLADESAIPTPQGISIVLAERISDGVAMVLLSVLGVIAFPRFWPAFALAAGLLAAVIALSQIRPLAQRILLGAERVPLVARFARSLHTFYEGAHQLFKPRATLLAVALGTLAWSGEGLATYLIVRGLGGPGGWTTFSMSVFVLAFSTIVGAVSTLPGGLGAADASMTALFSLVLPMSRAQAAGATLLLRFATLWFGVGLGLLTWALARRSLFQSRAGGQLEPGESV